MKHLLKLMDLSENEILDILNLADQLKYEKKHNIEHHYLKGKSLGMIFQKSSTRTRVSFETGMYQLGGQALFLSPRDLQIGRGEPIEDTARVLSRYLDGIMIRTFAQQEVEDLAKYGSIPIINGLTDFAHPCQVLADLMTIREYKGEFDNLKLTFVGDGNNMANSLIVGCLKVGMRVAIACPDDHRPDESVLEFAKAYGDKFFMTSDVLKACENSDALYTDVWASMGQEGEAEERKKVFADYQINDAALEVANKDALVLHCLPAHRGDEITAKVRSAQPESFAEG
ncbi:MAG: ornithine carbamoyltransferase, partial [Clostridia bacterium]|nr:ornithine carbamoyltransferase [Clostridia bacterium]